MQKASGVCACVRRGGDDEISEIVSAHNDGGLGGFWSAELKSVARERTYPRSSLIVYFELQWR